MANEYDDIVSSMLEASPDPAAPAGSVNEYDDVVGQMADYEDTTIRANVDSASRTSPQERAQVIDISKRAGVEPAVVDLSRVEVETKLKQDETLRQVQDSPVVRRLLLDPNFTAIAQPDINTLVKIEKDTRTVLEHSQTILNTGLTKYNNDGSGTTFMGSVENWPELNNGQPTLVPTFIGGKQYKPATPEGKAAILDYIANSGRDWPTSTNKDPDAAIQEVLAIERATHAEMEKQSDPYAGMGPVAKAQAMRAQQYNVMSQKLKTAWDVVRDTFGYGIEKFGPAIAQIGLDTAKQQAASLAKPIGLSDESWQTYKTFMESEEGTKLIAAQTKELNDLIALHTPDDLDVVQEAFVSAATSIGMQFPGTVLTAVSGSPYPLLAGIFTITAIPEYGDARAEGLDPQQAAAYALAKGGLEVLTEYLPAESLAKMLGAKDINKVALQYILGELGGEQINTLAGTVVDVIAGMDKQMADALVAGDSELAWSIQSRRQLVTLLSTGVQSGVQGGTMKLVHQGLQARQDRLFAALDDQTKIATLFNDAKQSETRKIAPEETLKLVREVEDDTGELADVIISRDYAEEILSTVDAQEDAVANPAIDSIRQQLEATQASGEDVVISAAEFIAYLPEQVGAEDVLAHVKLDPMGDTYAEWQAKDEAATQRLNDLVAEAELNADVHKNAKAIYEQIRTELEAATEFTGEVSAYSAQLVPALVTKIATQFGISPEEVFRMNALSIAEGNTDVAGKLVNKLGEMSEQRASIMDTEIAKAKETVASNTKEMARLNQELSTVSPESQQATAIQTKLTELQQANEATSKEIEALEADRVMYQAKPVMSQNSLARKLMAGKEQTDGQAEGTTETAEPTGTAEDTAQLEGGEQRDIFESDAETPTGRQNPGTTVAEGSETLSIDDIDSIVEADDRPWVAPAKKVNSSNLPGEANAEAEQIVAVVKKRASEAADVAVAEGVIEPKGNTAASKKAYSRNRGRFYEGFQDGWSSPENKPTRSPVKLAGYEAGVAWRKTQEGADLLAQALAGIEAQKPIVEGWKETARDIGRTEDNSSKVVISLFDFTGAWSQPWIDAGYTVIQADIQIGDNLLDLSVINDILAQAEAEGKTVDGVIAAPPCRSFSSAGAQWTSQRENVDKVMVAKRYGDWAALYYERPIEVGKALAAITEIVVKRGNPRFFAMENPVGTINSKENMNLPSPTLAFDPYSFGDPYTKKTQLWGTFNPNLPTAGVVPVNWSTVHKMVGANKADKAARSITPSGFAYAFFMANHEAGQPLMVPRSDAEILAQEALNHTAYRMYANTLSKAFAGSIGDTKLEWAVDAELRSHYEFAGDTDLDILKTHMAMMREDAETLQKAYEELVATMPADLQAAIGLEELHTEAMAELAAGLQPEETEAAYQYIAMMKDVDVALLSGEEMYAETGIASPKALDHFLRVVQESGMEFDPGLADAEIARFNEGGQGMLFQSSVTSAMDQGDMFIDVAKTSREENDAALTGMTFDQATSWLMANIDDVFEKEIAVKAMRNIERLKKMGMTFDFRVAHVGDRVPASLNRGHGVSQYTFSKDGGKTTVWVNGADSGALSGVDPGTLLHEMIHAATQVSIHFGNMRKMSDTKLGKDVAALYEVSNVAIQHFNDRVEQWKRGEIELTEIEKKIHTGQNTLETPHEVVAWAMSNQAARDYFETIPYKSENVLSAFVKALRRLLNLPASADTVLTEVIRLTDVILDDNIADLQFAHLEGTNASVTGGPTRIEGLSGAGIAETDAEWAVHATRNEYRAKRADLVAKALSIMDKNEFAEWAYEEPGEVKYIKTRYGLTPAEFHNNVHKGNLDHVKSIAQDTRRRVLAAEAGFPMVQIEGGRAKLLSQSMHHGSPYRFDEFDMDKIGTGEGAQAYGWGLYFAEQSGVAQGYIVRKPTLEHMDEADADAIRAALKKVGNLGFDTRGEVIAAIKEYDDWAERWDVSDEAGKELVALVEKTGLRDIDNSGHIYEVDISDEAVAKMLDWDAEVGRDLIDLLYEIDEKVASRLNFPQEGVTGGDFYEALKEALADKKLKETGEYSDFQAARNASEYLLGLGIPGIKYLDGNSRNKRGWFVSKPMMSRPNVWTVYERSPGKQSYEFGSEKEATDWAEARNKEDAASRTSNMVLFSTAPITIKSINGKAVTKAESAEILGQSDKRGSIQLPTQEGQGSLIRMMQAHDKSTFLHEFSHWGLDLYRTMAQDPRADESFKRDLAAIQDWLGVDSLNNLTTEQHERFAEHFEIYLMEGKAPSLSLKRAFRLFAEWLKEIYRSLGPGKLFLDKQTRDMFDHFLASDAEIEAVEADMAYRGIFKSAQEAGMTDEEYAAYIKQQDFASDEAKDKLRVKILRQLRRQTEKWWKEELADRRDRIAKVLLEGEPGKNGAPPTEGEAVYRLRAFLRAKEVPGMENKLDRRLVYEMLGLQDESLATDPNVVDPELDSLSVAIAKLGGIDRAEAEKQGIDPANWASIRHTVNVYEDVPVIQDDGTTKLVKRKTGTRQGFIRNPWNYPVDATKPIFKGKGGRTFDDIAQSLAEDGYLMSQDANELLAKLDKELFGDTQYSVRADMNRLYGEARDKQPAPTNIRGMTKFNGAHPEDIADAFGFESAFEMLEILVGAPKRAVKAAALAEAEMLAEHGDILNDGTLEAEALMAAHNAERGKAILKELNQIGRMLNKAVVARDILRSSARQHIATLPRSQLKPAIYIKAEVNAAGIAAQALQKGDLELAHKAKQQQLEAHYRWREAFAAKQRTDKVDKRVTQIARTTYSPRRANPEIIEYLKNLVGAVMVKERHDAGVLKATKDAMQAVGNWIATYNSNDQALVSIMGAVFTESEGRTALEMIDVLENGKPLHSMTIGEIDNLKAVIDSLYHAAVKTSDKERAYYDRWVQHDVLREATAVDREDKTLPPDYYTAGKVPGKILSFLDRLVDIRKYKEWKEQFDVYHLKLWLLMEEFDGMKKMGPAYKAVVTRLKHAAMAQMVLNDEVHAELEAIFKGHGRIMYRRHNPARYDAPVQLDSGLRKQFSTSERIMLVLNWGNPDNQEAVIKQSLTPMTPADVIRIADSLTKEERQIVENVWKLMDKYRGEKAELEKSQTGVAPKFVEGEPFELSDGTVMSGGYFPLMADTTLSHFGSRQEIISRGKGMLNGVITQAGTVHNYTKARKGFGGNQLDLDMHGISRHLEEVIHDLSHRQAVKDVDRLFRNPHFKKAYIKAMGHTKYDALNKRLLTVAGGQIHSTQLSGLEKFFRKARTGVSIKALTFSAATGLTQLYGATTAIAELGADVMAEGTADFLANPVENARFIKANSIMMRDRVEYMARDPAVIFREMSGAQINEKVVRYGFMPLLYADYAVSLPTWWSAYRVGMNNMADPNNKNFTSEQDAIDFADDVVFHTQQSGLDMDLSGVESGGEFFRSLVMMYSAWSAIHNILKASKARTVLGEQSYARYAFNLVTVLAIPAMFELLRGGDDWDDEEDNWFWNPYIRELLALQLSRTVGTREMATYMQYGIEAVQPIIQMIIAPMKAARQIYDSYESGEIDAGLITEVNNMLVLYTQSPLFGAQVAKIEKYLLLMDQGKVDDPNLWDAIMHGRPDDESESSTAAGGF